MPWPADISQIARRLMTCMSQDHGQDGAVSSHWQWQRLCTWHLETSKAKMQGESITLSSLPYEPFPANIHEAAPQQSSSDFSLRVAHLVEEGALHLPPCRCSCTVQTRQLESLNNCAWRFMDKGRKAAARCFAPRMIHTAHLHLEASMLLLRQV